METSRVNSHNSLSKLVSISLPLTGMETFSCAKSRDLVFSFQFLFPSRGWKRYIARVWLHNSAEFQFLFPSRGWKHLSNKRSGYGNFQRFQFLFPSRGWKQVTCVGNLSLVISFNFSSPHGDGNLSPCAEAVLGTCVSISLPLTGMETMHIMVQI